MSEPLNNIRQAILDNGKPTEERRTHHWFECVYMEDYSDDVISTIATMGVPCDAPLYINNSIQQDKEQA